MSANYNIILIVINYVEMQMIWHLYGINYKRYFSVVLASQENHMQFQPINIFSVSDHSRHLHMSDLETHTPTLKTAQCVNNTETLTNSDSWQTSSP